MEDFFIMKHMQEHGMGHLENMDDILEKTFKEGCEHGYKKAMKEFESYSGKSSMSLKEGFAEKIEKLKEKYK